MRLVCRHGLVWRQGGSVSGNVTTPTGTAKRVPAQVRARGVGRARVSGSYGATVGTAGSDSIGGGFGSRANTTLLPITVAAILFDDDDALQARAQIDPLAAPVSDKPNTPPELAKPIEATAPPAPITAPVVLAVMRRASPAPAVVAPLVRPAPVRRHAHGKTLAMKRSKSAMIRSVRTEYI